MNANGSAAATISSSLRLRYAALSPFARKVLVAAHETNTISRLHLVPADVWADPNGIVDDNPLVKVPALQTQHGILVNSALICEYLDQLNGTPFLIPQQPDQRWSVLSAYSVADGVMEAAVAHVVERIRRPTEYQWSGWLDRQFGKIERGLDHLSKVCPADGTRVDISTITLGCLLEYLDMRFPTYDWRAEQPKMAIWLKEFGLRPSMVTTRPKL